MGSDGLKIAAVRENQVIFVTDEARKRGRLYDEAQDSYSSERPIDSFIRSGYWRLPTPDDIERFSRFSKLSKGGDGSGNFGHAGRPGEVGGSAPEGESVADGSSNKEKEGREAKEKPASGPKESASTREARSEARDKSEEREAPKERFTESGKQISVKDFAADAKDITREQRMSQAKLSDIHATLKKDLSEISSGKASLHEVSGKLSTGNADAISANAKSLLGNYTHYLAGDATSTARDYIDRVGQILHDPSLKDLDAKQVDAMVQDSMQKLVYQEIESNRQQFTDHGIRHLVGNALRADDIMMKMSDGSVPAIDRLAQSFIMVNHDIGYTTPLVREGGLRGITISNDHKDFSEAIAREQKPMWDEGKIFSAEQYERICSIIKTHDDPKIDFEKDLMGTATRISDNLSLFNDEKLPSMFKYVDGGEHYLTQMGRAAAAKDFKEFEQTRDQLYERIDKSNLSTALKRDLKAGTKELNYMTPKYALGTLAGSISGVSKSGGKLMVDIKHDEFDSFLQKYFDMGQKQAVKFLKDYGVTDFSKTEYDLGGKLRLRVLGVKPAKVAKGDLPGHEFHGNQYTDGVGGAGGSTASHVAPPTSDEDIPRFLHDVKATPEYQEVNQRLTDLAKDVTGKCGSAPGDVTFWSLEQYSDENGNLLPERQAKHEEIISKFFNPKAVAPEGERPKIVFVMGPTASGKTTAGVPEAKKITGEYTYLNADDVKEEFKDDYEGWNAAAVHEESTQIVEGDLLARAMDARHNIVFDLTGKNAKKMIEQVQLMHENGYDVHIVNIDVPSHVAVGRAWTRFLKKGRYVDIDYCYKKMDHNPAKTFETLKNMKEVKSATSFNTEGAEPRRIYP